MGCYVIMILHYLQYKYCFKLNILRFQISRWTDMWAAWVGFVWSDIYMAWLDLTKRVKKGPTSYWVRWSTHHDCAHGPHGTMSHSAVWHHNAHGTISMLGHVLHIVVYCFFFYNGKFYSNIVVYCFSFIHLNCIEYHCHFAFIWLGRKHLMSNPTARSNFRPSLCYRLQYS